MAEFKGTKGKWKYEVKYGKGTPRISVIIPNSERFQQEIILGRISDDDCTVSSCCCVREHANAKLIAAAPELLEALEEIIEMNRQTALDQYGDAEKAESWSCVTIARKAIKKATE